MITRFLITLSCFAAVIAMPKFRGDDAFVIDPTPDTEDYDLLPATVEVYRAKPTVPSPKASSSVAKITVVSAESGTTTQPEELEGHSPLEVLDAALGVVNTPFTKLVGSNSLRRLLRLVGPTREDMIAGLKMAHDLPTAAPDATHKRLPIMKLPTDIPPVVDHLFGFHENIDDLIAAAKTTPAPLFPLDHAIKPLLPDNEITKYIKNAFAV